MFYRSLLFFITSLAITGPAFSEDRRWEDEPKGTLGARLGVSSPSLNLTTWQDDNLAPDLDYKNNFQSRNYLGLSYGDLSVAFTINTNSMQDPTIYGKSSGNDIIFRYYGLKWSTEFFYQYSKGFYLENMTTIDPSFEDGDPRYQRPDISLSLIGANVIYNLNEERFSMSGAFGYNRRQLRSGGAWVLVGSASRHQFKANDSLIPPAVQAGYGNFNYVREADIYSAAAGAGGAYNYVYGKMSLAGLLGVAAAGQKTTFRLVGGRVDAYALRAKGFGKFAWGYNGDNFIIGLSSYFDNVTAGFENSSFGSSSLESNFFIGYKFKDMHMLWLDNLIEKYWPSDGSKPQK